MARLMAGGLGLSFRQLLEACKGSKFLDLELRDGILGGFALTPIGRMLRNNLKEEFRRGEPGMAVYEGSSGISLEKNLRFVQDTFATDLPFGIAVEERFEDRTVSLNENYGLHLEEGSLLSCSYFVNPTMSMEFMYKAQRQRKIWWMRFACDPGRYFISDLRQDAESKVQSVAIKARFAGEEVALEQLELIPGSVMREEMGDFQVKIGKSSRKITPNVLRVRQCVELATLEVILDAFENSGTSSVRIHRKLAPYKCGIICLSEADPSQLEELRDLAKHLSNVLRKANITVLDCSSQNGSSERSLNKQLRHLDSIAVPYSLLLQEQSLQNGLFQLRSRDTTISETIHISDLPDYLLKIITS
ncbi:DNA polymerase subunit gamma-2, mitochondrial-like isoform X1 [Ochlerotatus camptorhynchus]|uniref:DNA polymerase subunit gamma-2, mitochondrial-like isoform X1 n=1 Tax=Ochlerotatus camptorhynchus TaxID=644619 RepID=UPI0031D43F33